MECEMQETWAGIHTNLKHMFRYRANQHLIVLNLCSVSIDKTLVTKVMTFRVSQNLNYVKCVNTVKSTI